MDLSTRYSFLPWALALGSLHILLEDSGQNQPKKFVIFTAFVNIENKIVEGDNLLLVLSLERGYDKRDYLRLKT